MVTISTATVDPNKKNIQNNHEYISNIMYNHTCII